MNFSSETPSAVAVDASFVVLDDDVEVLLLMLLLVLRQLIVAASAFKSLARTSANMSSIASSLLALAALTFLPLPLKLPSLFWSCLGILSGVGKVSQKRVFVDLRDTKYITKIVIVGCTRSGCSQAP
jgi:hypothetical protein